MAAAEEAVDENVSGRVKAAATDDENGNDREAEAAVEDENANDHAVADVSDHEVDRLARVFPSYRPDIHQISCRP